MLMTKVSGLGSTEAHCPSGPTTSKPPVSSCHRSVTYAIRGVRQRKFQGGKHGGGTDRSKIGMTPNPSIPSLFPIRRRIMQQPQTMIPPLDTLYEVIGFQIERDRQEGHDLEVEVVTREVERVHRFFESG